MAVKWLVSLLAATSYLQGKLLAFSCMLKVHKEWN